MNVPQILLASQSPRRAELLDQIGIQFEVISVDVPELLKAGESPTEFVQRLALDKARAGWLASDRHLPALGSDTIVVLDDEILGKPVSTDDAEVMLKRLSGRTHRVMTAVAVVKAEQEAIRLSISEVSFREIAEAERKAYILTGESSDKAGGYAVQGQAAVFIEKLQGSYSGVMGLPLFETAELFKEFAIDVI
ncbi:MAG: septum formation inhibitor Maf [Sulfuriflexus sp.]|nr:septum formation inhibitor Maf [Sulfuriflexus sp.]